MTVFNGTVYGPTHVKFDFEGGGFAINGTATSNFKSNPLLKGYLVLKFSDVSIFGLPEKLILCIKKHCNI